MATEVINYNYLKDKNCFFLTKDSMVGDTTPNKAGVFHFDAPAADEKIVFTAYNPSDYTSYIEFITSEDYKGASLKKIELVPFEHYAAVVDSKFVKDSNGKIKIKVTPDSGNNMNQSQIMIYMIYSGVETK